MFSFTDPHLSKVLHASNTYIDISINHPDNGRIKELFKMKSRSSYLTVINSRNWFPFERNCKDRALKTITLDLYQPINYPILRLFYLQNATSYLTIVNSDYTQHTICNHCGSNYNPLTRKIFRELNRKKKNEKWCSHERSKFLQSFNQFDKFYYYHSTYEFLTPSLVPKW